MYAFRYRRDAGLCADISPSTCQVLDAMRELRATRTLVLSGTPLQNHVGELWSVLNFIDPERFADHDAFIRR